MYEKKFKDDWKSVKKELDKAGVKKPAETKRILLWEKRVASGVGAALKKLDGADPGDLAKTTAKNVTAYKAALNDLQVAMTKVVSEMESDIEKEKSLEKEEKSTYYRGAKLLRAKLKDYEAQAEKRLAEMEQVASKAGEAEKRMRLFAPKAKAAFAHAVAAVQKVKSKPEPAVYHQEVVPAIKEIVNVCSEATTIETWNIKGFSADGWATLRRDISGLASSVSEIFAKKEDVLAEVSKVSAQIKVGLQLLAQVKL